MSRPVAVHPDGSRALPLSRLLQPLLRLLQPLSRLLRRVKATERERAHGECGPLLLRLRRLLRCGATAAAATMMLPGPATARARACPR